MSAKREGRGVASAPESETKTLEMSPSFLGFIPLMEVMLVTVARCRMGRWVRVRRVEVKRVRRAWEVNILAEFDLDYFVVVINFGKTITLKEIKSCIFLFRECANK
jgi:hypothetical protein